MMKSLRAHALSQSSRFACSVALGAVAPRFVAQVDTWVNNSGVEWTAKRMKVLRNCALKLRGQAGDLYNSKGEYKLPVRQVIQLYQENSIAYNHKSLIPKGIYGEVVKAYVESRKPSVTRNLDVALRAYTSLFLHQTSWTQFKKSEKSINTPCSASPEALQEGIDRVLKGWEILRKGIPDHHFNQEGHLKVGKANLHHLHPFTSVHSSKSWEDPYKGEKVAIPYSKWVASFCSSTAWPKAFRTDADAAEWDPEWKGLYSQEVFDFTRSTVFHSRVDNTYTGHISFIQEGGAKGRVVAVPNAKLQWAFEPLHSALDSLLREIPQVSCVHDQNNGGYWLLRHLGGKYGIGSIDLSSATDRFPAELQYALLDHLGLHPWVEAFKEVCSDDWLAVTPDGKERVWHYECGQPMGLYSSFPLFALTYTCLVCGLAAEHGREGSRSILEFSKVHGFSELFRNLGDDIVVATADLCNALLRQLEALGCGISYDKTFISKRIGEFAGFVALHTNRGNTIYRPYKHSRSRSTPNAIGLLHAVGRRILHTKNRYWEDKLLLYRRSLKWRFPDLSPSVPVTPDRCTPNEEYIDHVRLTNLLNAHILSNPNEGRIRYGNTFTGQEYELWSIEDLACYLLNQEVPDDEVYLSRAVLSPGMEVSLAMRREEWYRPVSNIKTDPLMKQETLDDLDRLTTLFEEISLSNEDVQPQKEGIDISPLLQDWDIKVPE